MNEQARNILSTYIERKHHDTETAAKVSGNSAAAFMAKLEGREDFTRGDMLRLIAFYGISKKDAAALLFQQEAWSR